MPTDIAEYFRIPEDRAPPGDYPARLELLKFTAVRLGRTSRHERLDRLWHYWMGIYRVDEGPYRGFPAVLNVCLDTYDNPGSFFRQILLAYGHEAGLPPADLSPGNPDAVKADDLLNQRVIIQIGYSEPKLALIPIVLRVKPPDGDHRNTVQRTKPSCGPGMRVYRV